MQSRCEGWVENLGLLCGMFCIKTPTVSCHARVCAHYRFEHRHALADVRGARPTPAPRFDTCSGLCKSGFVVSIRGLEVRKRV